MWLDSQTQSEKLQQWVLKAIEQGNLDKFEALLRLPVLSNDEQLLLSCFSCVSQLPWDLTKEAMIQLLLLKSMQRYLSNKAIYSNASFQDYSSQSFPKYIHLICLDQNMLRMQWENVKRLLTLVHVSDYQLMLWTDNLSDVEIFDMALSKALKKSLIVQPFQALFPIIQENYHDALMGSQHLKSEIIISFLVETIKREEFDEASHLLRFLILYYFGGVYLDNNLKIVTCLASDSAFGELATKTGIKLYTPKNSAIMLLHRSDVMGAVLQHPVIRKAIDLWFYHYFINLNLFGWPVKKNKNDIHLDNKFKLVDQQLINDMDPLAMAINRFIKEYQENFNTELDFEDFAFLSCTEIFTHQNSLGEIVQKTKEQIYFHRNHHIIFQSTEH